MAHLPSRLPASEADLADWMVYADELQREGDPRGVELAHELSLGPNTTKKQLRDFARRSRGFGDNHGQAELAWVLGHVREARLSPRHYAWINHDALHDLVRERLQPSLARLETIHLDGGVHESQRAGILRDLANLPDSCTRVVNLASSTRTTTLDVQDFVSLLPAQLTHVALEHMNVTNTQALIDDRFETVELPYPLTLLDLSLDRMTKRLTVRVDTLPPGRPHHRIEVRDGAGFIQPDGRAIAVVPPSIFELQREVAGAIPIRVQLAHALPVRMFVTEHRGEIRRAIRPGVTIDRIGDRWTLETGTGTIVDDIEYERGQRVELHDGVRIQFGAADGVFYTHDLASRARAAQS